MASIPSKKPHVLLVGYGYWGPNLLRNVISSQLFEVAGVVDSRREARDKCGASWPSVPLFEALDPALEKSGAGAAIIATPPNTHCELALRCIERGLSLLIEKPMAVSSEECRKILTAATTKKVEVMVDHTFVYNPAVRLIADEVRSGAMGRLCYYDSIRANFGGYQPGVNVIWDLAPHDISILDYWIGGKLPIRVSAFAVKHLGAAVENSAYITLEYGDGFIGHIHLNWLAPIKIRTTILGGASKMVVYDENLSTEKVRIYDRSFSADTDHRQAYRTGNMVSPVVPDAEALQNVVRAFHGKVTAGKAVATDGQAGYRVVQILEAISLSAARKGEPVPLTEDFLEQASTKRAA